MQIYNHDAKSLKCHMQNKIERERQEINSVLIKYTNQKVDDKKKQLDDDHEED